MLWCIWQALPHVSNTQRQVCPGFFTSLFSDVFMLLQHVQHFTCRWCISVLIMKLSSEVCVGQQSPRTTFVSHSDSLKMLTGVQNRVAMPTPTFRANMQSTKSNIRELYWDSCWSLFQPYLYSWILSRDWKNRITGISNQNGFPP